MLDKQETKELLKKLGYEVTHSYMDLFYLGKDILCVEVKFDPRKGLPYKGLPKRVVVSWDFDSVVNWVYTKFPKENVQAIYLPLGDLPLMDSYFRRIYLLDSYSSKSPPKFDKSYMNGHGPRVALGMRYGLPSLVYAAKRVIKEKHLKSYKFVFMCRIGESFGGFVGAGEWDYYKRVYDKIKKKNDK